MERGLVSGRLAATDSTHVKANASRESEYLAEVPEEPGVYWERLDSYEEEGLEELARRTGRRRKKRTKQIKRDKRRTHKRVSSTDPEAGHMNRPGKPRGQHYLSHQTVDTDNGIIIGLTVTPGDVYDSAPYLEQIEHIHKNVIPLQAAAADAAYDFPLAHRVLEEHGIDFFVRPQPVHDRTAAELKRDAFSYDETQDVYLCPNGKHLKLHSLRRSASGLHFDASGRLFCGPFPSARLLCDTLSTGPNRDALKAGIDCPKIMLYLSLVILTDGYWGAIKSCQQVGSDISYLPCYPHIYQELRHGQDGSRLPEGKLRWGIMPPSGRAEQSGVVAETGRIGRAGCVPYCLAGTGNNYHTAGQLNG